METRPSRRAALGTLAASAALGLTPTPLAIDAAHAGEGVDATVYACANRVISLFQKTGVLSARVDAAWEDVNSRRPQIPVLPSDQAWGCLARAGSPMPPDDVNIARLVLMMGRREIAEEDEIRSEDAPRWGRLKEIDRINFDWEAERARAEQMQTKYEDAVSELRDAQNTLLASRPQTVAALRILIGALIKSEAFDCIEAEELARALVDAPALTASM